MAEESSDVASNGEKRPPVPFKDDECSVPPRITNPGSVEVSPSTNGGDALPDQTITPPATHPFPDDKGHIAKVNSMIQELSDNHAMLEDQLKGSMSTIRELLDQREKHLLATYQETFNSKLSSLNHYKELSTDVPPEEQGAQRHQPQPPFLSGGLGGGTFCGFVPDMTNLTHSTASLILENRREVSVGDEMRTSVIGSLSKEGLFWVRILPDPAGLQDLMLQNLSNSIGMELSLTPPPAPFTSVHVGDLCCALYAQDQRWYRVRVIERSKSQKVKVYFVDYGNVEVIPVNDLSELHPKFLVYPFQMIQCCLSDKPDLVYQREVRWKFTDMTHGSDLKVKILGHLPPNSDGGGKVNTVQLTNCSKAESFDVGASILVMAEGAAPAQSHPTITNQATASTTSLASSTSSSTSLSTSSSATSSTTTTTTSSTIEPHPKTTPTVTITQESPSSASASTSSEHLNAAECSSFSSFISSPDQTISEVTGSSSQMSLASFPKEMTSPHPSLPESDHSGEPNSLVEKKVQRSPSPGGDVKEPLLLGNDIIDSAAQIKVTPPIVVNHSNNAAARSASHSPIPVWNNRETMESQSEGVVSLKHPKLKQGEKLEVYVTTPLSCGGTFWVQMTSAEEPEFIEMVERFQKNYQDHPPSPFFFSPGDLCASQFSEDNCWYRSRVEDVAKDKFLVRYLDYGNTEERRKDYIAILRSEFKTIPFQAVQCSIACQDCNTFTQKEIDRFNELTDSKKLTAKILRVQDQVIYVKLLLIHPDITVDLNEEIYTADVIKLGESLSFSLDDPPLKELKSASEPPLSISSAKKMTSSTNWADYMDELQSPQNDGIFTLAGQEDAHFGGGGSAPPPSSLRSSPSPRPPHSHQNNRTTPPPFSDHSTGKMNSHRSRSPNVGVPHQTGSTTSINSNRSSSAPRIHSNALGMVRKNLLMAEKKNDRARSEYSRSPDSAVMKPATSESYAYSSSSSSSSSISLSTSPSAPPGLPQPKGMRSINQISRNGASFPPTGRWKKSPEPDSSQIMDREGGSRAVDGLNGMHLSGSPRPLSVQTYKSPCGFSREQEDFDNLPNSTRLFVKNIPVEKSMEELKAIFEQFGEVKGLVPVENRRHVVYIYMDPEGATSAIDNLHGKAIAKISRPLIIQVSPSPHYYQ